MHSLTFPIGLSSLMSSTSYAVTVEPHSGVSADCFKLVILFPSVCKLHMEPFVPRKVALEVTFLGIDSAILVYIMVAQSGLP